MKFLVFCLCTVLATQLTVGEECTYTMEKMCSFVPGATFNVRGCWYTCRIKAEFEVFSGTKLNGTACKSIVGNVDGICKHGLCWPNE